MSNNCEKKFDLSAADKLRIAGMFIHMVIGFIILILTAAHYYFTEVC